MNEATTAHFYPNAKDDNTRNLAANFQLLTQVIGWNKQEAETIKCAFEPGNRLKLTSILWSWDCRGYKEMSKESPKITIPN